jgi:putative membrane protein
MAGFLLRIVIVAIGLWLASELISGIDFRDGATLAVAALLLGIVNAFVRPIAVLLTLPLSIITLGFFLLVINAGMLGLVAWLLDGFSIAGFWSALFGSIIVSITGWLASWFIGPRGRVEVMVVRHRFDPSSRHRPARPNASQAWPDYGPARSCNSPPRSRRRAMSAVCKAERSVGE